MPEQKFQAGPVAVAVWKNQSQKDGKTIEFRTIQVDRAYKDKEGNWQHTGNLRVNDIPKAIRALTKAYDYILFEGKSQIQDNSEPISDQEEIVM